MGDVSQCQGAALLGLTDMLNVAHSPTCDRDHLYERMRCAGRGPVACTSGSDGQTTPGRPSAVQHVRGKYDMIVSKLVLPIPQQGQDMPVSWPYRLSHLGLRVRPL
jgi:hypothetical protein